MNRKTLLALPLLALASGGVFLLGQFLSPVEDRSARPLLVPEEVNLGLVEKGIGYDAPIPITNQSSGLIHLTHFRVTCGCMGVFHRTADRLEPLESATLRPGETIDAVVHLNTSAKLNRFFSHRLSFETDYPGYEQVSVPIRGEVKLGILSFPESLNWGALLPGQEDVRTIHLADLRKGAARIPFTAHCDHPAVTVESPEEVDRGDFGVELPSDCRVYRVTIRIKAPARGDLRGKVVVRTADNELLCEVPFFGSVEPLVSVVPSTLALPRAGSPEPWQVRLSCRSAVPCEWSVQTVPAGFSVQFTDTSIVSLRCASDPLPPEGTYTLCFSARTNDGQVYSLPVKVTIIHLVSSPARK